MPEVDLMAELDATECRCEDHEPDPATVHRCPMHASWEIHRLGEVVTWVTAQRDAAREETRTWRTMHRDLRVERDRAVTLIRQCADGRDEYAAAAPEPLRATLLTQAGALRSAARIVEGDRSVAFHLLPSWRWSEEMRAEMEQPVTAHPVATDPAEVVADLGLTGTWDAPGSDAEPEDATCNQCGNPTREYPHDDGCETCRTGDDEQARVRHADGKHEPARWTARTGRVHWAPSVVRDAAEQLGQLVTALGDAEQAAVEAQAIGSPDGGVRIAGVHLPWLHLACLLDMARTIVGTPERVTDPTPAEESTGG